MRSATRHAATGSSRTTRSSRPSSSAPARGCNSTCVRWARPSTTSCSRFVERHGVRDGIVQHGALMPLAHARRWAAAGFRQTICCGFTWGKGDVYRQGVRRRVDRRPESVATPARRGTRAGGVDRLGPEEPVGADVAGADAISSGTPGSATTVPIRSSPAPRRSRCGPAVRRRSSTGPSSAGCASGSYADLVVVDRDPLTCELDDLPAVAVLSTVTAGRTAFSAH